MDRPRFPHKGQHLAPRLYRHILLRYRVPRRFHLDAPYIHLSDLDASIWSVVSPRTCRALGEFVLARLPLRSLPADLPLPQVPNDLALADLLLENRTRNALCRHGLTTGADLSGICPDQLLDLRGFGVKCLIDLLVSLECNETPLPRSAPEHSPESQDSPNPSNKLPKVAPTSTAQLYFRCCARSLPHRARALAAKFSTLAELEDLLHGNPNRTPNVGRSTVRALKSLLRDSLALPELPWAPDTRLRVFHNLLTSLQLPLHQSKRLEAQFSEQAGSGQLHFFSLLIQLLQAGHLLAGQEVVILQGRYPVLMDSTKRTLDEIGDQVHLTRERVRQLEKRLFDSDLPAAVGRLVPAYLSSPHSAYLSASPSIFTVDKHFADTLNSSEQTKITPHFIALVLECIHRPDYVLFANGPAAHLIRKDIATHLHIPQLLGTIQGWLSESRPLDMKVATSALLDDIGNSSSSHLSIIEEIVRGAGYPVIAGTIHLPRTKPVQTQHAIQVALRELGKPSHISDIMATIKALWPDFSRGKAAVLSQLRQDCHFFGRTSTYALPEWIGGSIRPGTIRDITECFLESFAEPQHISDIFHYVRHYRNTTLENVLANLAAARERFEVTGRYVALVDGPKTILSRPPDSSSSNPRPTLAVAHLNGLFSDWLTPAYSPLASIDRRPFLLTCSTANFSFSVYVFQLREPSASAEDDYSIRIPAANSPQPAAAHQDPPGITLPLGLEPTMEVAVLFCPRQFGSLQEGHRMYVPRSTVAQALSGEIGLSLDPAPTLAFPRRLATEALDTYLTRIV